MTATHPTFAPRLLALPAGVIKARGYTPLLRCAREMGTLVLTASPIVLIGLLNMAMSIMDVVMLGQHDPNGLTAAVVVSDLYSILFNFSAGFAGMVAPQVAAAIGAEVRCHVYTIVRRAILLVLALAGVGASILLLLPAVLEAAGFRQLGLAAAYTRFMAGTFIFMLLFAVARTALSAMGRPGPALLAIVVALPVKAVTNYAFIWGAWGAPELGVAGAGLGSLMAAAVMAGAATVSLFLSRSRSEFDRAKAPPLALSGMWPATRTGLLLGLVALSETGMFLASTMLVGLFAPQDLIAHTLAFRSMAFLYLLLTGLGQSVTVRVAFLQARAMRKAEVHALRAVIWCSLALAACVLLVLVVGADAVAHALTPMAQAEAVLTRSIAELLSIAGLTLAAMIPGHLITALLRARNNIVVPTCISLTSYWGMSLTTMLMLAGTGHGARGIWLGLLLGALTCSACFATYVRRCGSPMLRLLGRTS